MKPLKHKTKKKSHNFIFALMLSFSSAIKVGIISESAKPHKFSSADNFPKNRGSAPLTGQLQWQGQGQRKHSKTAARSVSELEIKAVYHDEVTGLAYANSARRFGELSSS